MAILFFKNRFGGFQKKKPDPCIQGSGCMGDAFLGDSVKITSLSLSYLSFLTLSLCCYNLSLLPRLNPDCFLDWLDFA